MPSEIHEKNQPLLFSPSLHCQDAMEPSLASRSEAEYQKILSDNTHPFWDGPSTNILHPSLYALRDQYEAILLATPDERRNLTSTLALGMLSYAHYTKGYTNYQPISDHTFTSSPRVVFIGPFTSVRPPIPGPPETLPPRESRELHHQELESLRSHPRVPRDYGNWIKCGNNENYVENGPNRDYLNDTTCVPYMGPSEVTRSRYGRSPAITPLEPFYHVPPMESFDSMQYNDSYVAPLHEPLPGSSSTVSGSSKQASTTFNSSETSSKHGNKIKDTPGSILTPSQIGGDSEAKVSYAVKARLNHHVPSPATPARSSRGTQTATFSGVSETGIYFERDFLRSRVNPNLQRTRALIKFGSERPNGSPTPRRRHVFRRPSPLIIEEDVASE